MISSVLVGASSVAGGCARSLTCLDHVMPGTPQGDVQVLVTNEAGVPLAGVEVTLSHPANPGPSASTCCIQVIDGHAVTDREGLATPGKWSATCGGSEVTARRSGWRTISRADAHGKIWFVLGPAESTLGGLSNISLASVAPRVTSVRAPDYSARR